MVIALAAALGIWLLQSRKQASDSALVPVPLTSYPGFEGYPSFSPDGTQVAFMWCPDEPAPNCDIYVKQIGVEPPSRLTTDPAEDFSPAWSPDGRFIAFLRKLPTNKTTLLLIPQRGGQERVLGESGVTYFTLDPEAPYGSYLAWTPDSKWLAVAGGDAGVPQAGVLLLNVDTREARRLPAAVNSLAFSPDGRTLALNQGGPPERLCLLHLANDYRPDGELEQIVSTASYNTRNFGITWTPDGRELVFSSGNFSNNGLWRAAAAPGAKPHRLPFASDGASAPVISRQGNRLVYIANRTDINIWRVDLGSPGKDPDRPVRLIASTWQDRDPDYSPDGKRITFMSNRSGSCEIWVCDRDGTHAAQLTALGGARAFGPKWAPDGRSIAFTASRAGVYIVSANGGPARPMTSYPAGGKWPSWSHDGKWLYFSSKRSGSDAIWKWPVEGGEAVRITQHGADTPLESPDGRFVYYEKGWPEHCSVWRVPVAGGDEVKVIDWTHTDAGWTVGKQGIYFFTPPDAQGHSDLCLYKFTTGEKTKILTIERPVYERLAVSRDERSILYGQFDQLGSDLMLVENFQ